MIPWTLYGADGSSSEYERHLLSILNDSEKNAIAVTLKDRQLMETSNGKEISMELEDREWMTLEIEADFTQRRFNVVADLILLSDFIPMSHTSAMA